MIEEAIHKTFDLAKAKNWDKTYWAIDIHETLIKPNYSRDEIPTEWYTLALKALKMMSDRADIYTILFTCSHPTEIQKYLEYFKKYDIYFDNINKNPEVKTQENGYGYYEDKMYLNVLMDDKAGFDATTDWKYVIAALENKSQLFDPIDWGFEITSLSNYMYKVNNVTSLKIAYNKNTETWKFEIIHLLSGFYEIVYSGPILSMRHGDQIIQTTFKKYNLTDKTYN